MIVLGILALIIGFLLGIPVLYPIGLVLIVLGIALEVLGRTGRPVGRAHWY